MVRERLNAIDIAAVVKGLEASILGYNLTNIYDVTNRVFVLKFSRHEDKIFVLFEIGMRIHATAFQRSPGHLPSNFTAKLRKHLRARRLASVKQLGQDRIVDFCFSCGVHAQHLVVQLFLPGNVYLTDANYSVVAVLRQHNVGEAFFKVGQLYEIPSDPVPWDSPPDYGVLAPYLDGKKSATEVIKSLYPSVPGGLIEWAFKSCNLTKFANEDFRGADGGEGGSGDDDEDFKSKLNLVLSRLTGEISKITRASGKVPGFVLKSSKGEAIDYSPFDILRDVKQQQNSATVESFTDYNAALDSVFTSTEIAKQEKLEAPKKPKKLDKIKLDQDRRALKLKEDIESLQLQVELLADNYKLVDDCINLTRALLASGASWKQIEDEIQQQGRDDHPVAKHIYKVDIMAKLIHFRPDLTSKTTAKIDFGLSCHQNLEALYAEKKRMELKLVKTQLGRDYALRKVSKEPEAKLVKSKRDALQKRKTHTITKFRRRLWFEKFHWFITSDGFMVLGGKDLMQNEVLVKRYMTNGDLYFHADVHGASSCILKNPKAVVVPEASILETGCFAQCHSSAWDDKHIVQSWWVYWHQVSKTAPSGEYVPSGSFVIRGKKNFVPPQRLEMGLALVFHVPSASESKALALEEGRGNGGSLESLKTSGEALETSGESGGAFGVQGLPFAGSGVDGGTHSAKTPKPEEQEDSKARRTEAPRVGDGALGFRGGAFDDSLEGSSGRRGLSEDLAGSDGPLTGANNSLEADPLLSQHVKVVDPPPVAIKFIDPDESSVVPVVLQEGEFKRTKGRRPTGYPQEQSAEGADDVGTVDAEFSADRSGDLKKVDFCGDVVAVEFPASNLKRCKDRRATGFATEPIEVGFEDMSEDDFKSDGCSDVGDTSSSSGTSASESQADEEVQGFRGGSLEDLKGSGPPFTSFTSSQVDSVALDATGASDDGPCSGSVTFSKEIRVVAPLEAVSGDFKRTRSRKATGYPMGALQDADLGSCSGTDVDDTSDVDESDDGAPGFRGGGSDDFEDATNSDDDLKDFETGDSDNTSDSSTPSDSLDASGAASDDFCQEATFDDIDGTKDALKSSIDSKSGPESLEGLKISSTFTNAPSRFKPSTNTATRPTRAQNKTADYLGTASKELHLLLDELKVGYSGRQKGRRANAKLVKARKKYGLDDVETQRLRLLLTGSKVPSAKASQSSQKGLHAAPTAGATTTATTSATSATGASGGQRRHGELRPLDESELESCMHECLALVASPTCADGVVAAIPMCAPYSRVKSSRWHVKLVPGTMKKGSIASAALAHFVKQGGDLAPFVRVVTTDELVLALISNAKVA